MTTTSAPEDSADLGPDRRPVKAIPRPVIADVPCRASDIEPTKALHSVAILMRILSGLLLLLMVMQVVIGLTSTVAISYGVLIGEAVRLIIMAGLLWAAGDLADLFVKSHHDLRASRILLARLVARIAPVPAPRTTEPVDSDQLRGPGNAARTA